jgi:hypothetical protein
MDFQKHLARQLTFLQHSCALYDQGARDEAIRIATVARVLFHHTHDPTTRPREARSLVNQLGAPNVRLLSTSTKAADLGEYRGTSFRSNLAEMKSLYDDGIYEMVPNLGKHDNPAFRRMIPFTSWWGRELVYAFRSGTPGSDTQLIRLYRKDLVCIAANQDGGAHVDPELDYQYHALERGASCIMYGGRRFGPVPLAHAHFAALRQIGYEILNSPALIALK